MGRWVFLMTAAAGVLAPIDSNGGTFDPNTGRIDSSAAAIRYGFEPEDSVLGLEIFQYGPGPIRIEGQELQALDIVDDDAIEGATARSMGGNQSPVLLGVMEGLRDRLADRRIEVRIWQRSEGTRLRIFLLWFSGDVEAAAAIPSFAGLLDVGVLPLLPTGRVTDDGWVELSSGPVDFLLAHRLAPMLYIDDEHSIDSPPYVFSGEGRAWLDALEIHDLGPSAIPDALCNAVDEDTQCGDLGLCRLGRCADAAVVDGPSFTDGTLRDDFIERRIFERSQFAGHRAARAQLQAYSDTIDAAEAKRFWTTVTHATNTLGDGHSSAGLIAPVSPVGAGVCLHVAEADLLPNPSRLPMVFRSNAAHPIGRVVEIGDVLTEVDGLDVPSWKQVVDPLLSYNADPDGRDVVTTPQLLLVAMSKGSRVTFSRCPTAGTSCALDDLEEIVVDTATHTAAIWDARPPPWLSATTVCEPRFLRTVDAQDVAASTHVGRSDRDGVRILQINATPGPVDTPSIQWFNKIQSAFAPVPSKMLLDERRGDGGGFQGVQWLTKFFFAEGSYPADLLVPWLGDQDGNTELRRAMLQCTVDDKTGGYFTCGGVFLADDIFLIRPHPAPAAAADTKLAILTGQDGSGNDFLTHHLSKLRPAGTTRVFGPAQLFGAYGEVGGLPTHRVGFTGATLQLNDAVVLAGPDAPIDELVSGNGVVPDVIVFQRQSDAVRGVDTIVEAAMAWLLEDDQ